MPCTFLSLFIRSNAYTVKGGNRLGKFKPFRVISDLFCRFEDDDIPALGAQMTYYLILALFPFIIFLINLFSFTSLAADSGFTDSLKQYLPYDAWNIIDNIISSAIQNKSSTLLSFGGIGTLWAASNGVNALIRGLNKAYDKEETRPFWKVRLISLIFTLAFSIIIIFSFLMLVSGKIIEEHLFSSTGIPLFFQTLWNTIRYFIPILTMMSIFTLLYYYIPNHRVSFRETIPGAILSTLGWIIFSSFFSIYVNNFNSFSKIYGSLGGVIILLLWIYWSTVIVLLGGELNASLAFIRQGLKKPACKKFSVTLIAKKRK